MFWQDTVHQKQAADPRDILRLDILTGANPPSRRNFDGFLAQWELFTEDSAKIKQQAEALSEKSNT